MTISKNYITNKKVADHIFGYNTCSVCLSEHNLMHEYTGGDDYLVTCYDCGNEFWFPEWYVMEEYSELEIFDDLELDELKKEYDKNFSIGDLVWVSPSRCFGKVIGCYIDRNWDDNQKITVLDLIYYVRVQDDSIPIAISAECLKTDNK